MHITIPTSTLAEWLDLVSRFVSKHATLPILENIYISASIDSLTLKGTDMEKHIQLSLPAQVNQEWALTVNAKTFQNIIKSIDDSEIELLVSTDDTLTIKTTKDNFSIKGIGAHEYVALPEVQSEKTITIDTQTLIDGIRKIEYAVSEKNFSAVLTGILIYTADGETPSITFAGSDSFRLAEYQSPITTSDAIKVLLPKNNILDIQKVCHYQQSHGGNEVTMAFSDNMIAFRHKTESNIDIHATSLLIQGNFPDYRNESIMPTQYNTSVIVDAKALDKAIKKILILTRDINNYLLLKTEADTLTIQSGSTDKGDATTSIPVVITGDSKEIGINGKYIADFIKHVTGDELHIHIIDNQKPLVFKDPTDENYIYVARPLTK